MTPNNTISLESIDGFGPKGGENLAQAESRLHRECRTNPELIRQFHSDQVTYWWQRPIAGDVRFVTCHFESLKTTKLVLQDVVAAIGADLLCGYLSWVLRERDNPCTRNLSQKIAQLAIDVRNGKPADPITCGWSLLTDSKDHDGKHVSFELSYTDQNDIVNLTAIFNEA